jgi:thioredoxin-like negative regulator of GroEL
MLLRLAILLCLTVLAIIVAVALQRRRSEPPSSPSYRAVSEIDRSEFAHPEEPILVVMFGSTTCDTCPIVWETIESIGAPAERVDVQADPKRHQRYRIDGVPTTVIADSAGVVARTFFGPLSKAQIEEALRQMN